eukprot:3574897-Amphidinium_carterae.1
MLESPPGLVQHRSSSDETSDAMDVLCAGSGQSIGSRLPASHCGDPAVSPGATSHDIISLR